MKTVLRAALAAGFALAVSAHAQQAPRVTDAAGAAEAVTVTGKITAIDRANRLATVQGPEGRSVVLRVDPSVTRFDNVKVGDVLVLKYMQSIAIALEKSSGAIREATQTAPVTTKLPGDKPAGVVAQQTTITANVVAVDAKSQMVSLKGPAGNVVELKVKDAALLRDIKPGDQVRAVYNEALAIAVEDAPKSAAKK